MTLVKLTPETIEERRQRARAREAEDVRKQILKLQQGAIDRVRATMERRGRKVSAAAFYDADRNDLRPDWTGLALRHPDEDVVDDRETLVQRQRDLLQSNPFARAFLSVFLTHVVGEREWTMRSGAREDRLKTFGISEAAARDWRDRTQALWEETRDSLDITERCCSYHEFKRQAYRARFDGDAFTVIDRAAPITVRRRLPLALRLYEGDLCRKPHKLRDDDSIRDGVRLNKDGSPTAYFLFEDYPDSSSQFVIGGAETGEKFRRVKRYDSLGRLVVLHLLRGDLLRYGQTRGVPALTGVMTSLEDCGEAVEAGLIRQQIEADIALLVKRMSASPNQDHERIEWGKGSVVDVPSDTELDTLSPTNQAQILEPFIRMVMMSASAAMGFSSMLTLRDFTKANYSVSRATRLDSNKLFRGEQEWITSALDRPVWAAVMEQAWLNGLLPQSVPLLNDRGYPSEAYVELMRVNSIPPAQDLIDPPKEIPAMLLARDARIMTDARILAATGEEPETVYRQIQYEEERKAALGITGEAVDRGDAGTSEQNESSDPREADEVETDTGDLDPADVKAQLDAVGLAVRSGLLTPQQGDEEATRAKLGLPPMSEDVRKAWEVERVRRPVTLSAVQDNPAEQPADEQVEEVETE